MTGVIIGSSLLIVLVAVLRRLLRGRVSARLIYALWGLVLLRLLVPFSPELGLPSAEAAAREVYGRTELSEAMLPYERVTAPYAAGQSRGVLPEDDPIQPYIDAGEPAPEYRVELHNEGTPEAETEFVFLRPWTEVLSGYVRPIWLAGTLTALALLACINLSFAARLRRTRRPIGRTEAGLPAYETEAVASPCLFGLFRPAVYVRAEDAGRLRHVLTHEDCHYRQLDQLWALLRALCLALYWWDPLVWLAAGLSRTDCELACDEAASLLGQGTSGFFEEFEGGLVRVNVSGDACERITDLVRVRDALYYRAEGEITPEEAAQVLFTYLLESSNGLPQEDFPFVIKRAEGSAMRMTELDEDMWLVTQYLHFVFEGRGGNMSSGNMTLSGNGQYILMRSGDDWRLQLLDGLLAQYGGAGN